MSNPIDSIRESDTSIIIEGFATPSKSGASFAQMLIAFAKMYTSICNSSTAEANTSSAYSEEAIRLEGVKEQAIKKYRDQEALYERKMGSIDPVKQSTLYKQYQAQVMKLQAEESNEKNRIDTLVATSQSSSNQASNLFTTGLKGMNGIFDSANASLSKIMGTSESFVAQFATQYN